MKGLMRVAALAAALVIVPEVILMALGVQAPGERRDTWRGFTGAPPLFVREGERMVVAPMRVAPEKSDGQGRFLATSFDRTKGETTLRVFCVGGSMTYGRPWRAAKLQWPFQLEARLLESFPERDIEVVPVAAPMLGSGQLLNVVREVAGRDGDLIVVAMDHDERFYVPGLELAEWAQLPDEPGPIARWIRASRTGALLRDRMTPTMAEHLPSRIEDLALQHASVLPFAPDVFHRILDAKSGVPVSRPRMMSDETKEHLVDQYRHRIAAMAGVAGDADVPILFVARTRNLEDPMTTPFYVNPDDIQGGVASVRSQRYHQNSYRRGLAALATGEFAEALSQFERVRSIYRLDQDPWLSWLFSRAYKGMGQTADARKELERHGRSDVLNDSLALLAANGTIVLVDPYDALVEDGGGAVPGPTHFFSGFQPNARGHLVIAEAVHAAARSEGWLGGAVSASFEVRAREEADEGILIARSQRPWMDVADLCRATRWEDAVTAAQAPEVARHVMSQLYRAWALVRLGREEAARTVHAGLGGFVSPHSVDPLLRHPLTQAAAALLWLVEEDPFLE